MILSKRPDIDRFLAKPPADVRAAVIYGRDRGMVRERADLLAAKKADRPDDPFDTASLTDGDLDGEPGRLEEELSALSLMGGRRLVRLRLSDKIAAERAAAEALVAHAEGRLNPAAFFLVEAGELRKDSPLRKAAEKAPATAVMPCYEDETGDVVRLLRDSLQGEGVGLTHEALEMLAARLPRERGVARQEIERLILFLGPGSGVTAGPAELQDFLGVEPEASLFDAASDAFGARAGTAQANLRRAFAEGESGPAAVRAAGMHLAKLRRATVLTAAGAGAQEAAKQVGVFWKQEREFLRQLRAWGPDALDAVQPEVLNADRACKQTGSPDALLAERLFMTVAAKAKRLGL